MVKKAIFFQRYAFIGPGVEKTMIIDVNEMGGLGKGEHGLARPRRIEDIYVAGRMPGLSAAEDEEWPCRSRATSL